MSDSVDRELQQSESEAEAKALENLVLYLGTAEITPDGLVEGWRLYGEWYSRWATKISPMSGTLRNWHLQQFAELQKLLKGEEYEPESARAAHSTLEIGRDARGVLDMAKNFGTLERCNAYMDEMEKVGNDAGDLASWWDEYSREHNVGGA